jgi:hypothetical protein
MKRPSIPPRPNHQNESTVPPPVPKFTVPKSTVPKSTYPTPPPPPNLSGEGKNQPPAMPVEPPPIAHGESTNWLHIAVATGLGMLVLTAAITIAVVVQFRTPQIDVAIPQPVEIQANTAVVNTPSASENAVRDPISTANAIPTDNSASTENAVTRKKELLAAAQASQKKPVLLPVFQSVAGRLSSRVVAEGDQIRGLLPQIPAGWSNSLRAAIATADRDPASPTPTALTSIEVKVDEAKIAAVLAADLNLPADGAQCKADPRALETKIHWEESVQQASAKATEENKLIFMIHVSGNFEQTGFT